MIQATPYSALNLCNSVFFGGFSSEAWVLKDELVDWIPAFVVAGARLLFTAVVGDEVFAEVITVCSRVSRCERSKVKICGKRRERRRILFKFPRLRHRRTSSNS
jgi:hypothetical protein